MFSLYGEGIQRCTGKKSVWCDRRGVNGQGEAVFINENVVAVTENPGIGNPGIEKSHFCLYCVFHNIFQHQDVLRNFPPFELEINCVNTYFQYHAGGKQLVRLNELEVDALIDIPRVIRLIKATSSTLLGWNGVSILFACPGVGDMGKYERRVSVSCILSVWNLEELLITNLILDGRFKLEGSV